MNTLLCNGRVIDPSQMIDSRLDVLVQDGKILSLVMPGSCPTEWADKVIDASGMIVCPGFIDIHMHGDPIGADGKIEPCIFPAMLKMGVTSVLAGNCGTNKAHPAVYLEQVDRDGCAVNVAMLAGHTYFRSAAGVTDKYRTASEEEIRHMQYLIEEALDAGCMGISFGLRYVPGTTTEEFLQVASLAAKDRRLVSAHVRDDAANVFAAVEEFARAGKMYDLPLEVSHIGSMGGFGQMEQLLQQIDTYRAAGMDISADCYPYDAFCTGIGESTYDDGWLERYHCDYSTVEMCEGKYKGQRCTKEIFEEMRRDAPHALTVCYVMRAEDVDLAYSHPAVCIGSDGTLNQGQGHPRAAGAFPRFLSVYVREKKLVSLYDAVRRMTTMAAQHIGMPNKGTLRPGSDADIVVLDPETVKERSTFAQPMLEPVGIRRVLIAGNTALKDGQIVDGTLGRALRRK